MLALTTLLLLAGHPQLNVYFQSNLTDAAYQRKAFDKVAKAFNAPKSADCPPIGKKAVVQTVIGADGKLQSAKVSYESGSKAWDAAALAAVQKAAPFGPLPKAFTAPTVEAHFHFTYGP
jgi:protein TonB